MRGGDISNETPPRIIVIIDVVTESVIKEDKKFLRTTKERVYSKINRLALSELWRLSNMYGLSVELAAFEEDGWTEEGLTSFIDKLERRGGNPFNYSELYLDMDDFIGDLPYRSNLKGVIDIRTRVARYGSWGIELNNL